MRFDPLAHPCTDANASTGAFLARPTGPSHVRPPENLFLRELATSFPSIITPTHVPELDFKGKREKSSCGANRSLSLPKYTTEAFTLPVFLSASAISTPNSESCYMGPDVRPGALNAHSFRLAPVHNEPP